MTRQPGIWLLVLTSLLAAGGSSCPTLRPYAEPAPVVFQSQPTLGQIIDYFNSTTMRVQQLQTTGATLKSPGIPALQANIAFERPRRFRLQAGFAGPEIDLGSNDHLFWIWAKRGQPPAVYFCRHDQFDYSAAREILPVRPEWIGEALGLVYFDPALVHQGPFPHGPDQLEIRSIIPSPRGNLTKITRIDAVHAWVLQQEVLDASGQRLAVAIAAQHRHDPLVGVSLPRRVDIQLPTAQLSFTIQVADYLINQPGGNPQQLWSMPQIDGYPPIDLCSPGSQSFSAPAPQPAFNPGPSPPPTSGSYPANLAPYAPAGPPYTATSGVAYAAPGISPSAVPPESPYATRATTPYASRLRRQ